MKRVLLAVAAIVAGLSGCSTPAKFVERTPEGGVVAIPDNTDVFPTYYQSEAMSLIRKHVGPNFEIVDERRHSVGKRTVNDQQMHDDFFDNQHIQNTTTTQDLMEWRITYRKKTPSKLANRDLKSQQPGPIAPAGGPPPSGNVEPAGGIIPPVGPTPPVVPAGGPNSTSNNNGPGVSGSVGAFIGTMH